jgi:hypothetical protein
MFLGGSYHDRDNPHSNKASHGKPAVWMTLVCNLKDGGDSRAAAGRLRTTGDDLTRMWMMTMIFYGGTGTDCTETNGWTAMRRRQQRREEEGNNTNTNTNNSNNTSRGNTNDRPTVKMTPGARCDTVRRVHR